MRVLLRWWATLMTAAIVVQIGLAGYGAFHAADRLDPKGATIDGDQFEHGFDAHAALGTLLVPVALVLVVLAAAAKSGRRKVTLTGGILALVVVQMLLGGAGASMPWLLGVLHAVNAMLILGLTSMLAVRLWREDAATVAQPASEPA